MVQESPRVANNNFFSMSQRNHRDPNWVIPKMTQKSPEMALISPVMPFEKKTTWPLWQVKPKWLFSNKKLEHYWFLWFFLFGLFFKLVCWCVPTVGGNFQMMSWFFTPILGEEHLLRPNCPCRWHGREHHKVGWFSRKISGSLDLQDGQDMGLYSWSLRLYTIFKPWKSWCLEYFGSTPHPVTVTTRIIYNIFSRESHKPSFATVTGWGVDPRNTTFFTFGGCCKHDQFASYSTSGSLWQIASC